MVMLIVVSKTDFYGFHTLNLNFLSKTHLYVKATNYYRCFQIGIILIETTNRVAQSRSLLKKLEA
jgi:hypothetical protein